MRNKSLFGLMLSSSLALSVLAGCAVPTPTGAGAGKELVTPGTRLPGNSAVTAPGTSANQPATQPGANTAATSPVAAIAQALSAKQLIEQATAGTTDALADEKDMDDYDRLADDAGYAIMQLAAEKPAVTAPVKPLPELAPTKPQPGTLEAPKPLMPPKPPAMGEGAGKGAEHRCGPHMPKPSAPPIKPAANAEGLKRLELSDQKPVAGGEVKPTAANEAKPIAAPAIAKAPMGNEMRCGGGLQLERVAQLKAAAEAKRKQMEEGARKLKLAQEAMKKTKDREEAAKKAVQGRLEKLKDDRDRMKGALGKADWVDNGDGTKTKTVEFDVDKTINGKTFARKAKLVRTINAEKQLVSMSADFEQTLPGGLSRKSSRTKVLQADGSYKVSFDSSVTLPNGFTHVIEWDKTIAADGAVSGTGTHTILDADGKEVKKVALTMSGKDEAPEAKLSDEGGKLSGSVKIDQSGAPTVEAKEGETAVPVKVETDANGTISTGVTEEVPAAPAAPAVAS